MRYHCIIPATIATLLSFSCASADIPQEGCEITVEPEPVVMVINEVKEEEGQEPAAKADEEPAFSIISSSPGLQSALLTIAHPKSADLSLLSVDGGGHITRIEADGRTAYVTIGGLESLTSYDLTICYSDSPAAGPVSLTTGSFAGRYSWIPADGSAADPFVLRVSEAPAGSAYRYHIFLDPEDSAFPDGHDEDIRIAPLVEAGEPSLDGMRYKDAPASYKWTNEKWNTGSMEPSKIRYVKAADTGTGDEIRTLVASVALGFTAEADVRYAFHEDGGTAYLAFCNRMDPGIANGFLKKNPSPGIRPYESDEYWYALERE